MTDTKEYDIIFAGGGAAGCLIAARLAAADPSLKILILEGGLHTKDLPANTQPARYLSHLAPTSTTVTFNIGNPAPEIMGRQLITPSGRCVGGASSINFAMYTRAQCSDYDDWERVHGNPGWGSADLIPLMQKTETYQAGDPNSNPKLKRTHGFSGPLKVSYGGAFTNVGKAFLDTAKAYDKAYEPTDDINGMLEETSVNKYGRWEKWIDAETGKRSDVPHHFIYDKGHDNITILDGKHVNHVIFEGTRAVGVEYTNDIITHPNSDQNPTIAKASKLVVLSAGAFGSPQILERSGIGAKKILDEFSVKQLVDLPGVGENYQDHNLIFAPFLAAPEADTLDAIFRNEKEEVDEYVALWEKEGKGLMAHNGLDAGVKFRPTTEELIELGPQFEKQWAEYFANAPDKPVLYVGSMSAYVGDPSFATARKYFSIGYYTQYPASRGSVHIKSANDQQVSPDFQPGFLRDEADIAALRWGYKKARELGRRMEFFQGELVGPGHPVFPAGSAAACGEASGPVPIDAPDIVYSEEDEAALELFSRKAVQTTWHSLGTCSMMQREKGGVVDAQLNVYGVQGLKVADISIAPSNVAANTYSTALTIGEKAAVIIAKELGLKDF